MSRVAALVLAAGHSRRFGADKRVALLPGGGGMLSTSLQRALEVFSSVTLVLREGDDPAALGVPSDVQVLFNPQSKQGMAGSLVLGMQHLLHCDAEAVAVLLGDMPCIRAQTLRRLVASSRGDGIVLPCWQGSRGHPVVFGRRFWPQLLTLVGDIGAREIVRRHADCVSVLPVEDAGVCVDIDDAAALERLYSPN